MKVLIIVPEYLLLLLYRNINVRASDRQKISTLEKIRRKKYQEQHSK